MDILSPSEFDKVRHRIDYRMTSALLPDATVEEFVDEAELEAVALFPSVAQTNDRLKLVVIYWSLYLMLDAVPTLIQRSLLQIGYRYETMDYKDRLAKAQATLNQHIDKLAATVDGDDADDTSFFKLSGGYRDSLKKARSQGGLTVPLCNSGE